MSILPKDLENMLGNEEEFKRSREANGDRATCQECHHEFRMVHNEDERNLENIQLIEEFGKCSNCYDEDEEDLLGDKLRAEYQDNMRDEAEDDDEMTLGSMDRF